MLLWGALHFPTLITCIAEQRRSDRTLAATMLLSFRLLLGRFGG
jgi:hypothetical protein